MKKPKRSPALNYPNIIPEQHTPGEILIDLNKISQRLTQGIEANVKRMLQEDAVVGRWVRLSFPDRFEEFLKRAREESKFRKIQKKEGKW